MSEENVEKIESLQRGFDAYSRGDFDAAVENFHPEAVLVPAGRQPIIRGVGAIRAWMEPDAFESQVIEPLEFSVAANKVLVRHISKIHGAGSGIEAEFVNWSVYTFNEAGRVARFEIYLPNQEAEALEAAGLSPPRRWARPGLWARHWRLRRQRRLREQAMSEENVSR
jgi:ketosteroid isomerase-like protein